MKIVLVVPGSGDNFYCQNCLRDQSLAAALRAAGHEAVLTPMYLPLPGVTGDTPLFYSAVQVYLEHKFPLVRSAPRWLERLLNSPKLLKWAAGRAGSTSAAGLEELTLSILLGEDGDHARQLDRLVSWLTREKPALVHLSNALLVGLARRIHRELGIPVVCSLQDEHQWIDAMPEKYSLRIWHAMSERANDVDVFVAVSRHYAKMMGERMAISPGKMRVVYPGIAAADFPLAPLDFSRPAIGYLSRMTESLGLGILIDAFTDLKRDPRFADLRLVIAGGCGPSDRKFLKIQRRRLQAKNLRSHVEFMPRFDENSRVEFFHSICALSVPVPSGEAFGLYQLEALACGVPLVQPHVGAFPEIIDATGGGLLYQPNTAEKLAETLASLLAQPEKIRQLGRCGRAAIARQFTPEQTVNGMLAIYESLVRE